MGTPRTELRQAKRRANECYDCPLPAEAGKTRCRKHLAKGAEGTARYAKTDKGRAVGAWRKSPEGHRSLNATAREYRRGSGRFYYASTRARARGVSWTLTRAEWHLLIGKPCRYCGLPNTSKTGSGLDRLDNARGYEPGNVVPCCTECNIARGTAFTPEEMRVIGAAIRQVKLSRRR